MSNGDRYAPFNAADGLGFWLGASPYSLAAGRYGSGEGALQVNAIDGSPEFKLTVSLVNYGAPALLPGELYVKLPEAEDDSVVGRIQGALIALGLFESTGETVEQGYVTRYAAKWRFARCILDTHEGFEIDYRVECRDCRELMRVSYEDGKTRLLAKDAVQRIRNIGRSDRW